MLLASDSVPGRKRAFMGWGRACSFASHCESSTWTSGTRRTNKTDAAWSPPRGLQRTLMAKFRASVPAWRPAAASHRAAWHRNEAVDDGGRGEHLVLRHPLAAPHVPAARTITHSRGHSVSSCASGALGRPDEGRSLHAEKCSIAQRTAAMRIYQLFSRSTLAMTLHQRLV